MGVYSLFSVAVFVIHIIYHVISLVWLIAVVSLFFFCGIVIVSREVLRAFMGETWGLEEQS